MIKSIFRYPGGKSRAANLILSYAPFFYEEYREPFVGGGSVFFNISSDKKRWINDINCSLMEVYKALKNRPLDFIKKCRNVYPPLKKEKTTYSKKNSRPGSKKYNSRLKKIFDQVAYNKECDQAFRYFFINRTVWGGRVNYNHKMVSRMYFSNPFGWNIVKTKHLEQAACLLKDVKITSKDYSELLHVVGDNVWIYIDAPYIVNTDLSKMSQLYEFGFSYDDHIRLVEEIKKCKHKICISYDDKPQVRKWFTKEEGFFIYPIELTYCGTSSAYGHSKKKKKGQELIITNYCVEKKRLRNIC